MHYIDEVDITNKRVLLRTDYNVSLNANHQISNDERIRQSLPTIKYLLKHHNTIIILSHLGRPHGVEKSLSLEPVFKKLQSFLPEIDIKFVHDFKSLEMENTRTPQSIRIVLLENIRFNEGEEKNDLHFSKELAKLGDVYVNDAFSVSHRKSASIVGLAKLLPSYGGLLMKKEIENLHRVTEKVEHPFVTIMGGAKIATKIALVHKLIDISDYVLIGGALANTFLKALGMEVGRSLFEVGEIEHAKKLLHFAQIKKTRVLLPLDVYVGDRDGKNVLLKSTQAVTKHDTIFDIGPETQATFAQAILQAKTILWNGPMGYFEKDAYRRGTDFIYYAITANSTATSIVGGGETLAALSHEDHLEKITHISTAGGAMLEYIENGTLPGIEALG